MAIYEYRATDPKKSCKHCKDTFDEMQTMSADPLSVCPECGNAVERIPSIPLVHYGKRQANQYEACKGAKYWRDNDGNRHRVTAADGDPKSPTVSSKRTRSDEQVAAIKKQASKERQKRLSRESYARFEKKMKKGK